MGQAGGRRYRGRRPSRRTWPWCAWTLCRLDSSDYWVGSGVLEISEEASENEGPHIPALEGLLLLHNAAAVDYRWYRGLSTMSSAEGVFKPKHRCCADWDFQGVQG
ncbi:hypothetical protein C8R46DRAFT_1345126 [Mycena filopes]|nr:hypothetical protein C8R46DRAFT_1345126 [Mycena filopes]